MYNPTVDRNYIVNIFIYPDEWRSIKGGTISSSTQYTCEIKSKSVHMILSDPTIKWNQKHKK